MAAKKQKVCLRNRIGVVPDPLLCPLIVSFPLLAVRDHFCLTHVTFFLSQCLAISLRSCKLTEYRLRNKAESHCLIKSNHPLSSAAFPHSTAFPSPSLRTMAEALGIVAAAV